MGFFWYGHGAPVNTRHLFMHATVGPLTAMADHSVLDRAAPEAKGGIMLYGSNSK
jgi:hypothetical protein